ncbi:MAG: hypothetical protein JSR46_01035 [Verrucomicrobia bacterium]|nr:hypothetical protein [Verrucomicrobiota bacterium]
MGICSKEALGASAVGGGLIGIGIYSAYSLTKAACATQTANTICNCFCNVMSNISESVCHQAFDLAYGKGLYPPYDVTLFCANEGACSLLKSSASWSFVFPSFTTCATVFGLAALGVCVYKHYSKQRQNPEAKELINS